LTPFDAVILGLVQGLTEFLPISSSAHVQIAQQLLGISMPKPQLTAFIATIQLGTEAAVVIYFWKDILRIAKAFFKSFRAKKNQPSIEDIQDSKMGWLIIFGSLPVVFIGLLFKDLIENDFRSLWVIAFTLIIFGLVLGVADKIGTRSKSLEQLTTKHGILFGLGQALAVIPGVSRSGGTISVGLLLGYSRQAAARYSFLLAIPAVVASGLFEFLTRYGELDSSIFIATGVATLVSFAVGYFVIVSLLKYLSRGSFLPFVIWRVGVGFALIILLSTNQLVA
jgi:undecaprenyl-diphosphatase